MFCFREIIMQQKMLLLPYSGIGISLKKRLLVGLYFKTDCDSVSYFFVSLHRAGCLHPRLFVCWFVSRITQQPLNGFPWNLDGGWVSAQNRPPLILVQIRVKTWIFFLTSYDVARCQHPYLSQGIIHGSVWKKEPYFDSWYRRWCGCK